MHLVTNTVKNFETNSVGTKYLTITDKAPSGVAPITVDSKGNNTIIVVPGANFLLSHHDLQNAKDTIERAKVLICQLEVSEKYIVIL